MAQIITTNSGGGSGGGGTSYTAGNGIDITSNEISIDEAVVQTVGNMVDNLTGADDDHYPTAKAVADAISGGGSGDVVGPASSTDGDIVLFDGATGKIIKDSGVGLSSKLDASALSNNNYGGAWQGDSTHTPTKGVLYDKIHTMDVEIGNKAADTSVVKLTGNQTINGEKTFGTSPVVPSKTSDATNTGTAIATEAQVYNVEQKIPSVINDLTSTSTTDALSANQGKVLKDTIDLYVGLGRFLSLWDASTGQPISFPLDTPYTYKTGDWYMVEIVSSANPPVNYKPDGSSYTGAASAVQDTTNNVEQRDVYIYDGTTWLFQKNNEIEVSFSDIAGQPTDNTNLATALSAKADDNAVVKLTGDQTIAGTKTFSTSPVVPSKTTDATNTGTAIATEAQVYKKQDTLESGTNIKTINGESVLGSGNISISAPSYTAGDGIDITNDEIGLDGTYGFPYMQGPAPSGFHVPLSTELQAVYNIWTALGGGSSDGTNFGIALKLPFAGNRSYSSADVSSQGTLGLYWSSSRYDANDAYSLAFLSSAINTQANGHCAMGFSVRCFKNSPVVPTSSWTKLYGTSIEAGGIFWSSADGLISLSSDGQNWITIADKNLGATQVWNNGDTLSEANCGYYYQRGNNYGFAWTGSVTTSSTKVDASNYGPGNYYSSDTFITASASPYDWSSVQNDNLWGGVAVSGSLVVGDKLYKIVVSSSAPASGTSSNIITIVTD